MRRRSIARAVKDAKISEFRFYDIMHAFASRFVVSNGDLKDGNRFGMDTRARFVGPRIVEKTLK